MRSHSVLFVAMSGVRIYDPELRSLGMTLPGFLERGKVIASLPSLGVLTLAGLTPKDWEVRYMDVDEVNPQTVDAVLSDPAELIAISALAARIDDAYLLADTVRAEARKVVIGGLHASALPEEVQLHADAVVVGEGEPVWHDVLSDARLGQLKPIYRSSPTRAFIEGTPPAYHLLDIERYNRITLQTTRGCPLDCAFCAASRLISPYKRKSMDQVERELDSILSIWKRPFIELADDNSFVHKSWSRELVALLARKRVRWFTETDVSVADDPRLLDLLASSGCAQLLIGFESVDVRSLREADSKDWKRKRRDRYLASIAAIQDRGISVNGCFVHGFDSDGPTCFESTLEFVREAGLTEVQVTVLTPFPGTALFSRLKREERLLEDRFWQKCTLFDVAFRPARMSVEELRSGFRWLVRELYAPRETERRKGLYRDCVRRSRHTVKEALAC